MAVTKMQLAVGGLTAAAATSSLLLATRRRAATFTSSPPHDAELGSLWAGVVEVMLSREVVGEDLFLVPSATRPPGTAQQPLPPWLQRHAVFALTAFDPPGEERTLQANTEANGRLWEAIQHLPRAPAAVWPTWGYNFAEDWREDGFCLAYPLGQRGEAQQAVVALAKQFGQGAIFEVSSRPRPSTLATHMHTDRQQQQQQPPISAVF